MRWGRPCSFLESLPKPESTWKQGIALYDPQQQRSLAFVYGHDPGVTCLSYAALALWFLGYPDQAQQRSHEALTLAQELSHPYSLGFALTVSCYSPSVPPGGAGQSKSGRGRNCARDRAGVSALLGAGNVCGRAGHWPSRDREKRGLARYARAWTLGGPRGQSCGGRICLALLVEAYGKGGQVEEGLTVLAEALAAVNRTEERMYEAELYRLKGELTLQAVQSPRVQSPKSTKKLKSVFSKPLRLLANNKRSRGSCAPQRASRVCGSSRTSGKKPGRCWPRSTAGSPKGLTRRTCKRRRRCWMNYRKETDGRMRACHLTIHCTVLPPAGGSG